MKSSESMALSSKKKATSIRMPVELAADIKELAKRYDRTENEQMVYMLKQQVKLEHEKEIDAMIAKDGAIIL